MTTHLQRTIDKLLQDENNYITEKGIERRGKNGRSEIILSMKGLLNNNDIPSAKPKRGRKPGIKDVVVENTEENTEV